MPNVSEHWDASMAKVEGQEDYILSVAFLPGNQVATSAPGDMMVRLWDAKTGKQMGRLKGHEDSVSSVVFSPDSRAIPPGSDDMTVRLIL
jgi:WD40 repeat protein